MNRRLFLVGGFSLVGRPVSAASDTGQVHCFATAECDVQVSIAFHDRYSSHGLCLTEALAAQNFCLSGGHFVGSLAIAQYKIRPRSKLHSVIALREHVRTIDRDSRLEERPPFDRKVKIHGGMASDLQVFGYQDMAGARAPESLDPWYYFRQDLYLEPRATPFLIIHWKHALSAIRLLDIIPGEGTRLV